MKKQIRGLGDKIKKVTKKTGIDKVVKALWDDCGCEKRAEQLNKMFPNKPNCLKESEYKRLKKFFDDVPVIIHAPEQQELLEIYNRVLNQRLNLTGCSSCVRNMKRQLERIYLEYKK
jgi:predicted ATP-grasp superfamily ATP-dependent carboligase